MGFGFITGYTWLIPTYPVYVGCGPGRFKRKEAHEGVIGPLRKHRLHWRAMGVRLLFEFNKRKEVIQCRVGPWRWWWEADAEPAVSEQFRAEWLHSATRKLRATKTWQPPFRLGRARGLAAPPAQPSQFSRKAAETRPSLRLGNRTIEAPFDPPIAAVGNSTMVRTHAPAGLDVVGRRTIF